MKTLISIALATVQSEALINDVKNAARLVGKRDARRANVYLVMKKVEDQDVPTPVITFDDTAPGLYGILLASVRWSVSQTKYVIVTNLFLDGNAADDLTEAMTTGLQSGKNEYEVPDMSNSQHGPEEIEETQKVTDADALQDRILIASNSTFNTSATFAEEEDAKSWATLQSNGGDYPSEIAYVSRENMTAPNALGAEICDKLGLAGLWIATVSATPNS